MSQAVGDKLTVRCSNCGNTIPISEALSQEALMAMEKEYRRQLTDLEVKLASDARNKVNYAEQQAKQAIAVEQAKNRQLYNDLAIATQKEEALKNREAALELTIAQRVRAESDQIRASTVQSLKTLHALEVTEKEQQLESMRKQIEELKSSQGSQQAQGEAAEVVIEVALRAVFPADRIEPVGKGEFGGDIVQSVIHNGIVTGKALWESKRTKNWQDQWLVKLRADKRAINADIAILVSQALPQIMIDTGDCFTFIEGVWVVRFDVIIPFAALMRQGISEAATARNAVIGMESKAAMLYQYIASNQFKGRMQALIEYSEAFRIDHQKEKKATLTMWAKRERQLDALFMAVTGLYGDFTGISDNVAEVKALSQMQLLED